MKRHKPVLLKETLELLRIEPGAVVIDATIGHGGHAAQMLRMAGPKGKLIGIDWDEQMLATAKENLKDVPGAKVFLHADFRDIPRRVSDAADAILLDFGVNLEHFEAVERGFSFQADAPLDMRMDRSSKETAAAWLNRATHGEIAKTLREFGGERFAGKVAAEIVSRRKQGRMKRTGDLVEAVLAAIPPKARDKRIHPATRTFQAVRIRVNDELEQLEQAIIAIADKLKDGGRLATLSYHSGEDGCAKRAMKLLAEDRRFRILTKKPIVPSEAERRDNPSSRSAKLRGIERIKEETE